MATGMFKIEYRSNDIASRSKALAVRLEDAGDRLSGVRTQLRAMPENSRNDYLSESSAFLKKKIQQLEQKRDQVQQLRGRVDRFMEDARNADGRVANHIEDTYEQFKKITGLGGGFWATLSDFADNLFGSGAAFLMLLLPGGHIVLAILSTVKLINAIRDWYANLPDEDKYKVKLALAFVGAVLAVAAFVASFPVSGVWTFIVAVAAAVKVVDSVVSLIKAGCALTAYQRGDAGLAEYLDGSKNGDFVGLIMEDAFGLNGEAVSLTYQTINFAASIVSFLKIGASIREAVNQYGSHLTYLEATVKEFKNGFFNTEDWKMGVVVLKMLPIFHETGLYSIKELIFNVDISDVVKAASAVYNFFDDYVKPVFMDPVPENFQEAVGSMLDMIPFVSDGKKAFDKFPRIEYKPIAE
jgi:gas vesicle protein